RTNGRYPARGRGKFPRSGHLERSGSADPEQRFDLRFEGKVERMADILPGAEGNFHVQGTLKGQALQPDVDLTLQASALKFEGYQVSKLNGKIKADLSEQGKLDADIKASEIRIQKEKINSASLRIQGNTDQHTLNLAVSGTPGKAWLAATGGLNEQTWQGRLTQLSLEQDQFGKWAIAQPADLRLSGKEATLSGFTLKHKNLNIALNGTWKQEKGWQVESAVDDFALKLLQEWQLPVPALDGTAKAHLTAQGKGALPEQAEFSLDLPKLTLTTESFEDDREEIGTTVWIWTKNNVTARLRNKTAILEAQTQFQDKSSASLKATVKNCYDFSKPEKMPLSGQLDLHLKDLSPIAHLSDEAVQATGKFGGRILLGGTV
ncbi:MAG: hypothetical protein D3909_18850, partial [Candidatus Electrothrix sp. ATG1]|nr:hypothetical protein [Candidatus Electrothrix sp. ATG1]